MTSLGHNELTVTELVMLRLGPSGVEAFVIIPNKRTYTSYITFRHNSHLIIAAMVWDIQYSQRVEMLDKYQMDNFAMATVEVKISMV